jgi:hypothetical protein
MQGTAVKIGVGAMIRSATRGELRFGIGYDGGPGGRYWTLRSAAHRPELYLRHSRVGAFFGFSLHEHPDHWQAKLVRRPGDDPEYQRWRRPEPWRPGCTKAMAVLMHAGLADHGVPARRSQIVWHQPLGPEHVAHFTVFIEDHGANQATWPGMRAMRTAFVGRLPMADRSTVVVVVHETLAHEVTFNVPGGVSAWDGMSQPIRTTVERGGEPWLMLRGPQDDGTVSVVEGPIEPTAR